MKIIYSPRAERDFRDIQNYISLDNPKAAISVAKRIRDVVKNTISLFPEIGRPWDNGPTRALFIAGIPYCIHYQIYDDHVEIITIHHTSRMPPDV